MADVKVKINREGAVALMKSPEAQRLMDEVSSKIADEANRQARQRFGDRIWADEIYTSDVKLGKVSAHGMAKTTPLSVRDNAKHNTLISALGSVK